jgi:hypothetical protein
LNWGFKGRVCREILFQKVNFGNNTIYASKKVLLMKISGIKNSIKIFEYAFKLLELKSNEGLKKLSEIRKPDNVLYLKDLKNEDDLGVNTLLACQGIPSLILLSFTIELTLKLLIYQETNREYRLHELKKTL